MSFYGFVANRLDIVAIRIKDERAVIIRVILGTQSRRPIIKPASRQRGAVERVDCTAVITSEGDMNRRAAAASHFCRFCMRTGADRLALLDPEVRDEPSPEPGAGRDFHRKRIAQRCQRRFIELPAALVIRGANTDVVNHSAT